MEEEEEGEEQSGLLDEEREEGKKEGEKTAVTSGDTQFPEEPTAQRPTGLLRHTSRSFTVTLKLTILSLSEHGWAPKQGRTQPLRPPEAGLTAGRGFSDTAGGNRRGGKRQQQAQTALRARTLTCLTLLISSFCLFC